jgi:hypothetical protein
MDYNQAMQQIQAMQMYRMMLGLGQDQGGMSQQPPMQYIGMDQGGGQQRQKPSFNPMSMINFMDTPTGMTPNATNAMGEAYSGWGAQTGDWGAMAGPAMYDATTVTGAGLAGEAGAAAGLGPFAAILAAISGFGLNNKRRDDNAW